MSTAGEPAFLSHPLLIIELDSRLEGEPTVDQQRFMRLGEIMQAVAAGDPAAVFRLHAEFGVQIATTLRRTLRRFGVDRIDADELQGMVLDACLELAECAGAWDAQRGVAPWTWAERRLAGLVSRWVGIHADELDSDDLDQLVTTRPGVASLPASEPLVGEVLAALAGRRNDCRLLVEALEQVTSPRARAILLEVRLQASMGDPSPAVTVAGELGLRPEAVRQVVKRARDRLRSLAAADPRYASLADLPLVA